MEIETVFKIQIGITFNRNVYRILNADFSADFETGFNT